ncbi:hypothetical protein EDB84DRAFT_1455273, partial [Lactarius hengduanensis]
ALAAFVVGASSSSSSLSSSLSSLSLVLVLVLVLVLSFVGASRSVGPGVVRTSRREGPRRVALLALSWTLRGRMMILPLAIEGSWCVVVPASRAFSCPWHVHRAVRPDLLSVHQSTPVLRIEYSERAPRKVSQS